ncbi:hypothetical protein ACQP1P_19675 [Dactylosporangium sp. CA-052675]|uniref:hypothetical protein n=1 Tax=Dactylosporangium sp. CA-052675 TaxID=3239927 RepID=UPI003D949FD8
MRQARGAVVLSGLLLLAACTSKTPPPAPDPSAAPAAPCRTDVIAGWHDAGLAVLWAGRTPDEDPDRKGTVALPAAVAAVDVRTGQVRSYCPLPGPAAAQQDYTLGLRQGGTDYPARLADVDLMLRTQYLSPDFRWFAAPGLPLVDVAAGKVAATDWTGTTVGLGRGVALLRTGEGAAAAWCTRSLPPKPGESCTPLTPPGGPGAFVIGAAGTPVWLPADAKPFTFGSATGYAGTDGTRLYAAETLTAAARKASADQLAPKDAPVDLDPAGLGGFMTTVPGQPAALRKGDDWFSVESASGGEIRTRQHHTTARATADSAFAWMWGGAPNRSRALADGGTVAVTAAVENDPATGRPVTRFGALVDGTDQVLDLTKDRGLRCPRPGSFCRILAWPDGTVGATSAPAP